MLHTSGVAMADSFHPKLNPGANLPWIVISRAPLVESGWYGWVSMEIFDCEMNDEDAGPEQWGERAHRSWNQLQAVIA